ncbi:ribonuclease HII [bacterium]|nr:MAG: ribonuclease HII [bacterium]
MAKFDLSLLPLRPDLAFETTLWSRGKLRVGGIDEAGRGAWAGPVSAAVVVLPADTALFDLLYGVRDSKEMSPAGRRRWAEIIRANAAAWAVGLASCQEIDTLGILPATRLAVKRALEQICPVPDHLLVDYLALPGVKVPQTPVVKGDARSLSVAAASILAKTSRDDLLVEMEKEFPGYGLGCHKGYGTAGHRAALNRMGPCPQHRLSYRPVAAVAGETV